MYTENKGVESIYGENCFSEALMSESLPKSIFREFKLVQSGEQILSAEVAEVIANAMKDWALQKGATHYSHWFQPLTGYTAEKHDSFISPNADGTVLMEFSGKELIQGEPDASSFPSGGLRTTFEARGYTAWDTGTPAFLKAHGNRLTLCIPTAFVSYTGEALDKKVPLLRAMDALNTQALRVLRSLGDRDVKRVHTYSGPEQEYFLVDKDLASARPDLKLTGRTVFGSMSAKGQEMDDHYFGAIKDRVADYMAEVNDELWKLGISAKTQHNEVAPNQFELATVFSSAAIATDWNQLVMEVLEKTANRRGLVCLLHEKPFAGVNGSGKHNNWNIGTDTGVNLLKPGKNPHNDARFLLFFTAVIKAVDVYAPILRASAASSGNDHRLGANEAPPAIVSIFLGDQIHEILEKLVSGEKVASREGGVLQIGVTSLPDLPMDVTDRNRTSPFAFTGNRFEFRMGGSSQSAAGSNAVLTTAMAEVLRQIADRMEASTDPIAEARDIIIENYRDHRRIIFNGNGYSDEWVIEAQERGLPNIGSTVEALLSYIEKDSVELFEQHKVLTSKELVSRVTIYLETYGQQINIEAGVMKEMADRLIYPASADYARKLAETVVALETSGIACGKQKDLLKRTAIALEGLLGASAELGEATEAALAMEDDAKEQAFAYRNRVVPAMAKLRGFGDELERLVDKRIWPFPSYEDLLFTL
ncbi:MAG: glutamine synthetase III [Spirochaetaceae bacterium]|nr:glutamine synthetase III [Spirochaetaceae bacterium]MDT8296874.1 glutamine synthetase III [Spirochaetaceae bacterium]